MSSSRLRLAFAGTPEIARIILESILTAGQHTVEVVFTQPDRPAGRGRKLKQSEVKLCALKHGLTVLQPQKPDELKPASLNDCDLMLVVAYGLLIPEEILAKPKLGCINIHTSLLPRWRGAAPIQRSIWAGDAETGVTIMQMDIGLDTGDMLKIATLPIEASDTSASMYEKLAGLGPDALIDCLADIATGKAEPVKQDDELANYAKKLSKEEARINWNDDAAHIERCVRAFNPWPMSHFEAAENSIKVWQSRVAEQTSDKPAKRFENWFIAQV